MAENTNPDLERQIRELKKLDHERAKEVAILRADMNTKQQEYKTDIARLAGETGSALERLRTDMAQRENRQLLATIVIVGVAAALLSLLITAQ
ncbi:MAG: hypothetical protein OXI59_01700 [Gemmatimonadota bacterium]|nr:hypothetical protein [Gemmatimonadota bacterium]MYB40439.1 hypothetical protein [Candidatus Saccharibacteria bacterium]